MIKKSWFLSPRAKRFIRAANVASRSLDFDMWPSYDSSHTIYVTQDRAAVVKRDERRRDRITKALHNRRIRIIRSLLNLQPG